MGTDAFEPRMNPFELRALDAKRDQEAIGRIWKETGWIDEDEQIKQLEHFLADATGLVATRQGHAEVSVTGHEGLTRYIESKLSMWGVTSVTVSRIARKQGLAGALTAGLLAEGARRGCSIAMLGMFDQGFYDRLGFGTGSYERRITFDPASISVPGTPRPPQRITTKDYEAVHRGLLAASRHHGSSWFEQSNTIRAELEWTKNAFGLGYFADGAAEITHHLWGKASGENGPDSIYWYSYRNDAELLEILQLIKTLGDQVHAVTMKEPPGIMLQDFLRQPFKQRRQTEKGLFEARHTAAAYWQLRILDLEAAIAATGGPEWPGVGELDVELELTDPVSSYLSGPLADALPHSSTAWRGIDGVWKLHLGKDSEARRLSKDDEATKPGGTRVSTDVGAFSRLWFGSASARSLAMQGRLHARPETVRALDGYFRLPEPHPWWDF